MQTFFHKVINNLSLKSDWEVSGPPRYLIEDKITYEDHMWTVSFVPVYSYVVLAVLKIVTKTVDKFFLKWS